MKKELFGGVGLDQLNSAFTIIRCNSSAGMKSPKGIAPPISGSRGSINPLRPVNDQMSTMGRPLSSHRHDLSTQEGGRDLNTIRQMEC